MNALPYRSGFDAERVSHIGGRHFLEVAKYEGISIEIGQARKRSSCTNRKRPPIQQFVDSRCRLQLRRRALVEAVGVETRQERVKRFCGPSGAGAAMHERRVRGDAVNPGRES